MNIQLSDVFIPILGKLHYTKQELLALEINQYFINQIAKRLELTYLENDDKIGNVCFVNDEQLRPEFKLFFSKSDVVTYLSFALKGVHFEIKTDEVPFPELDAFFRNQ